MIVTSITWIVLLSSVDLAWGSIAPTRTPTVSPSLLPTLTPTVKPSVIPTVLPSIKPTTLPTVLPTAMPSSYLSVYNKVFLSLGAGTGSSFTTTTSGDGGRATSAYMYGPRAFWEDSTGVIYVEDTDACCIRTYSPGGDTIVHLFAGTCGAAGDSTSGPATSGKLYYPYGIMGDTTGTIYFPDYNNHKIKKVTSGIVSVVGGTGTESQSGNGGLATAANIGYPTDLFIDSMGVLFINVFFDGQVRKIATDGIISLIAGVMASIGYTGDGGPATSAQMYYPEKIKADTTGLLYIGDSYNNVYRRVTTAGIISTYAGNGANDYLGENIAVTSQGINWPKSIDINKDSGDVYLVDGYNTRIYLVPALSGLINTFAGNGVSGNTGNGGPATSSTFDFPHQTQMDTNGNVYIVDYYNSNVRVVYSTQPTAAPTVVPTLIPTVIPSRSPSVTPTRSPTVNPSVAPSRAPSLMPSVLPTRTPSLTPSNTPTLTPTASPSSYNAMYDFIFLSAGKGTGSPTTSGTGGKATAAVFNGPKSIYQDSTGLMYIQDSNDNCHRTYNPMTDNIVRSFAGVCGSTGDTKTGAATSGLFSNPFGVMGDTLGNIFFTDYGNNRVKKVNSAGILSWLAGTGGETESHYGYPATSTTMPTPHDIFVDSSGVIYTNAYSYEQVLSINTDGTLALIAGMYNVNSFSGDGGAATSAKLSLPSRIRGDTTGLLFVSDSGNNRIRMISTVGIISTFAGSGGSTYAGENVAATSANFGDPRGIFIDNTVGDFYIADADLRRCSIILKSSLLMNTFAGTGISGNTGDGGAATAATFSVLQGFALDTNGNTYVVDYGNANVRVIYSTQPTGAPSFLPSAAPSVLPSLSPTLTPTVLPTQSPSVAPSCVPSVEPSVSPTVAPTVSPSIAPTVGPSVLPSLLPSNAPVDLIPTKMPSLQPTVIPSIIPSGSPTVAPSVAPSRLPSVLPTLNPTAIPTSSPVYHSSNASYPSYLVKNVGAFYGITSNGSVMAWGASGSGGDCSSVSHLLVNVSEVVSSKNAFAALKGNGEVVAWGLEVEISGWSEATDGRTVTSLVAAEQAFAGVTSSGGVIAFGADCCGGNVNQYGWAQYLASGVKAVRASAGAFCALKSDRTVYCWGSEFAGGGVSSLSRSDLSDVVSLSSTRSAFAGVTSTGNVLVWGSRKFGGVLSTSESTKLNGRTAFLVSNSVSFSAYTGSTGLMSWGEFSDENIAEGKEVKYIAHTATAFAVVLTDGSAVSWGEADAGGGVTLPASVNEIVGNHFAFAALLNSGTISAWGGSELGGEIDDDASLALVSVKRLYHTSRAFAAQKTDGSVIVWGSAAFGGSASVNSPLAGGVRLVCANEMAFTAVLYNGSAYSWGHTVSVGGGGFLPGNFSSILTC